MSPRITRGAFAPPATSLRFETGTWRDERPVHRHTPAPCHDACPAGEDPQAYIAAVQEGHLREAWERLVAANPMPAVTGRVCDHPCETACNRAQYDAALGIRAIERHLGDMALAEGWAYPLARPRDDAPRVAVVGAGPAGLAAAYHLVRHGLNATLFDQIQAPGGMLRMAIPTYRLPREVLDAELGRLLGVGIVFEPRQRLGRDMSLDELEASFAAVFLALGTHRPKPWSIDGAVPRDFQYGIHMLKEWSSVGALPVPERAVIHGGGNTAVDLARVLRFSGAREVHVVTASALPGTGAPPEDVMNAIAREVAQAKEEGIVFHPHRTITRLVLRADKLIGVELAHVRKLAREAGRKARVSFEGTEEILPADQVIPAIGEETEPGGIDELLAGHGLVAVDHWGRIDGRERLYAGGDMTGRAGTVSAAVGQGRMAGAAIAHALIGTPAPTPAEAPIPISRLNLSYFEPSPRHEPEVVPPAERKPEREIEGPLAPSRVRAEAARCFSCGECLACDNCWTFCPDTAVIKTVEVASDGSHYVFDYAYCKGCGLCASECPTGYIEMVEEPASAAAPAPKTR